MSSAPLSRTLGDIREVRGWLRDAQARRLWEAARSVPGGEQIVEIGSFQGLSTIVLARAAPADVEVVAIDPHAGTDVGPGRDGDSPANGRRDHSAFEENLRNHQVASQVRHVCRPSASAQADVEGEIALLYVDGSHRYRDALYDLRQWGARVRPGGSMFVHDSFASVFVTAATYRAIVFSREWLYVGREGTLAEYRREELHGAARALNAARQLAVLPVFARNVAVKLLRAVGLERLAIVVGHRVGDEVY
jgi:hypothetical protein